MPDKPREITQPQLLIGEGQEEVRFFNAFLKYLDRQDVQVENYGGKDQLRTRLKALPTRPGFSQVVTLGIVRDADNSPASAFQSVCDALRTTSLVVPERPAQMAGGSPRVGVLILPGGEMSGMLEDVCLDAVQTDFAMPCVDSYFQCLSEKNRRQPNNRAKARVHVWLASQVEPDLRLGEAAEKGYWPWDAPAFGALKAFLLGL
jgi:hypothetical protein